MKENTNIPKIKRKTENIHKIYNHLITTNEIMLIKMLLTTLFIIYQYIKTIIQQTNQHHKTNKLLQTRNVFNFDVELNKTMEIFRLYNKYSQQVY